MASIERIGALLLPAALGACTRASEEPRAAAPKDAALLAAKAGVGTKVHRSAAGDPGEDGWCLARSTEGGFSVLLPARFNDFTITAPAGDGKSTVTTCVVGTVTGDDRRYSAMRASRSDGKMQVDSLDAVGERFEKEGKLKSKSSISFLGMTGIDFQVGDARSSATMRCLASSGTLYQLIAEYPSGTEEAAVAPDIDRFFESFRLAEK